MDNCPQAHSHSLGSACPICKAPTFLIYKRKTRSDDYTSWEHESIMRLLGTDSLQTQMRLCLSCLHFFHYPFFDDKLVYSQHGFQQRQTLYETKYYQGKKYSPECNFDREWCEKSKNIFTFLSTIFEHLRTYAAIPQKKTVKLLDWGGGDGYLIETIALISRKVLKIGCDAYCFDYYPWAADVHSPYFTYIQSEELRQKGPFDIIFLCHVLEHVLSPCAVLEQCFDFLSEDGILIVYIPFQQYHALLPRSSLWEYHQHLFSGNSLVCALTASKYRNIKARVYALSYRGNKGSHIIATAQKRGRPSFCTPWRYVANIYFFFAVLLEALWRKMKGRYLNAE